MSEQQTIERTWKAPIALVWELWTTPDGLASWWCPRGYQVDVHHLDLRVGGGFSYTMRPEDGGAGGHRIDSTFTEVEAPRRLAYDSPFGDAVMTTAVTFSEQADGVRMVLEISATKAGMLGGAMKGWASTLERLEQLLAARAA